MNTEIIKKILFQYDNGRVSVLVEKDQIFIPPETRKLQGKIYHKNPDGMWYPGEGTPKEIWKPKVSKDEADHILSLLSHAWDPRFDLTTVQECFDFNMRENPIKDQFLLATTKEEILKLTVAVGIDIRIFDGEKDVLLSEQINPPKKEAEPELEM